MLQLAHTLVPYCRPAKLMAQGRRCSTQQKITLARRKRASCSLFGWLLALIGWQPYP